MMINLGELSIAEETSFVQSMMFFTGILDGSRSFGIDTSGTRLDNPTMFRPIIKLTNIFSDGTFGTEISVISCYSFLTENVRFECPPVKVSPVYDHIMLKFMIGSLERKVETINLLTEAKNISIENSFSESRGQNGQVPRTELRHSDNYYRSSRSNSDSPNGGIN